MVEHCSFQATLDLVGRKHCLRILWALSQREPRRFTDLREALGLNPVSLTERLRELEEAGVVRREEFAEAPPRVEYRLTPEGRELLAILDTLERWSKRHRRLASPRAPRA